MLAILTFLIFQTNQFSPLNNSRQLQSIDESIPKNRKLLLQYSWPNELNPERIASQLVMLWNTGAGNKKRILLICQ